MSFRPKSGFESRERVAV